VAFCFQSKFPLSTIAPPSVVPWPPRNFVSEFTTMSAPWSMGRSKIGEATVLSTMSGTPWAWATRARASMSQMFPAGFADALAKDRARFVVDQFGNRFGLVALREADGDSLAGKDVREERVRGAVELRDGDDVASEFRDIQHGIIDCGLAACWTHIASRPPSRAATRRSSTAVVGF